MASLGRNKEKYNFDKGQQKRRERRGPNRISRKDLLIEAIKKFTFEIHEFNSHKDTSRLEKFIDMVSQAYNIMVPPGAYWSAYEQYSIKIIEDDPKKGYNYSFKTQLGNTVLFNSLGRRLDDHKTIIEIYIK